MIQKLVIYFQNNKIKNYIFNAKKKWVQLIYFMFIVIIFILAFGISTQALLYPNQELDPRLLGNIFLPAYFILSGDDFKIRETIMSSIKAGLLSKD